MSSDVATRPKPSLLFRALRTASVTLLGLAGCVGVPEGVPVVRHFDVTRYLGTWYEIARLDHRFERGLTHVTAEYTRREDGGIGVLNRGYDPDAQRWKQVEGRAYFVSRPNVGRLKVSFFGPFYGGYNIIALDEAYRYALVCGPTRDYLWILSRTPALDPAIRDVLVARAAELGFDVEELISIEQDASS